MWNAGACGHHQGVPGFHIKRLVTWETAAMPITYAVVGYLKRTEGVDVYDSAASLNPLAFLRSR